MRRGGLDNLANLENRCTQCYGVGWVLDSSTTRLRQPLTAELIPCIIPDCPYSRRELVLLSINMAEFKIVAQPPGSQYIASVKRG